MAVITNLLLGDRPAVAMVYAISSLVHVREGAMHLAVTEAKHAVFLGSIPKGVAPWFVAETRLLVARTYLHLGDISMGRTLLREAQGILSRAPDVVVLAERVEQALARAEAMQAPLGVLATPLTPAEMRVLRFLPTYLTFPAIADELFVSRNTVKTQAISIYRKLGVSSRKPAVEAALGLGLLEP